MNNLTKRTLTGFIFILIVGSAIILGRVTFTALFALITYLALKEFYCMAEGMKVSPNKVPGIIAGLLIFISNALIAVDILPLKILLLNLPLIFLLFLLELYRRRPNPFTNVAYTLIGIIYVALPLSLLNYLADPGFTFNEFNHTYLLGFFAMVWFNDTGAYLIGTAIGKNRLLEKVSPKKTWEGAIGGGVTCLAAALVMSFFLSDLGLVNWIIISIIISVFGTYGDLFESLLKRCINTKDSGRILPGHGGVLDRFDGVLMATPFVFVYLTWVY